MRNAGKSAFVCEQTIRNVSCAWAARSDSMMLKALDRFLFSQTVMCRMSPRAEAQNAHCEYITPETRFLPRNRVSITSRLWRTPFLSDMLSLRRMPANTFSERSHDAFRLHPHSIGDRPGALRRATDSAHKNHAAVQRQGSLRPHDLAQRHQASRPAQSIHGQRRPAA